MSKIERKDELKEHIDFKLLESLLFNENDIMDIIISNRKVREIKTNRAFLFMIIEKLNEIIQWTKSLPIPFKPDPKIEEL